MCGYLRKLIHPSPHTPIAIDLTTIDVRLFFLEQSTSYSKRKQSLQDELEIFLRALPSQKSFSLPLHPIYASSNGKIDMVEPKFTAMVVPTWEIKHDVSAFSAAIVLRILVMLRHLKFYVFPMMMAFFLTMFGARHFAMDLLICLAFDGIPIPWSVPSLLSNCTLPFVISYKLIFSVVTSFDPPHPRVMLLISLCSALPCSNV